MKKHLRKKNFMGPNVRRILTVAFSRMLYANKNNQLKKDLRNISTTERERLRRNCNGRVTNKYFYSTTFVTWGTVKKSNTLVKL